MIPMTLGIVVRMTVIYWLRLYYDIIRLYYLMMLSGLLDNISGLHVALLSLCNDDYALWNWWVGLLYTICSTSTWLCGFA